MMIPFLLFSLNSVDAVTIHLARQDQIGFDVTGLDLLTFAVYDAEVDENLDWTKTLTVQPKPVTVLQVVSFDSIEPFAEVQS